MSTVAAGRHIVFVHKHFPLSGAEQVTVGIANYLSAQGWEVTVLAAYHHEHLYAPGSERSFAVETLPSPKVKWSPSVARFLRRFVEERGVDVLVTYRELLYMPWLKRKTGVKAVYVLHNTPFYEFLDIQDKKSESLGSRLFYACGTEKLLTWFYTAKYRRVYNWCDVYGVLCGAYGRRVAEVLGKVGEADKVCVLPNFIKCGTAKAGDKAHTVLYVGRLTHRDKRVDRLLRIWKTVQDALPDWKLKIVGEGRAEAALKRQAEELGLVRCSFEGHTNDTKKYYDEAAVLCLTSTFEGWPMVIAEAQADGVIPVVFDSFAAASEMVSSPDEGVLVRPFNEQAFALVLATLVKNKPRMERMRRAVLRKAATYTVERSGEAWMRMLDSLQDDRKRSAAPV